MAPDLDAIDFGVDVICMVDHPVRQPKQPLLDDFQMAGHELDLSFGGRYVADNLNKFRVVFKGICALPVLPPGPATG